MTDHDQQVLAAIVAFATDADAAMAPDVHDLLRRGASWAQIGKALGIGPAAAQKRFGCATA